MQLDDFFGLSRTFIRLQNRDFHRSFVEDNPLTARFSIIVGQRGVGKTTVLIQEILKHDSDRASTRILYLPVDHFLVGRSTLYEIADEFVKMGGELICFDEIHKYPAWSQELKSIFETFPRLKIIASGSSALEITKGSHDLSRRAIVYRMNGLSFREFITLKIGVHLDRIPLTELLAEHVRIADNIVSDLEKAGNKVMSLFHDYLKSGFYPYFVEYPDIGQFQMTLEQGVLTTLESDLPAIHQTLNGSSIGKIKRLLAIIADIVPYTTNLNTLKKSLDISDERTLKNYLKYLDDAGVIMTISNTDRGLKEMDKPNKIYLNNTNLCYALSSVKEPNIGSLRETFMLSMLRVSHKVTVPTQGDFLIDNSITIEVGGLSKTNKQLKEVDNSWLALDDIEIGTGKKVPLWLFGFIY